jgi:hypothetical protein
VLCWKIKHDKSIEGDHSCPASASVCLSRAVPPQSTGILTLLQLWFKLPLHVSLPNIWGPYASLLVFLSSCFVPIDSTCIFTTWLLSSCSVSCIQSTQLHCNVSKSMKHELLCKALITYYSYYYKLLSTSITSKRILGIEPVLIKWCISIFYRNMTIFCEKYRHYNKLLHM